MMGLDADTARLAGGAAACLLAWAALARRGAPRPYMAMLALAAASAALAVASLPLPALAAPSLSCACAACCAAALSAMREPPSGGALAAACAPAAAGVLASPAAPAAAGACCAGYLAAACAACALSGAGPGRAAALAGAAALALAQAADPAAPWACWALAAAAVALRPAGASPSGTYDPLTGLPNRAALADYLEGRMAEPGEGLCLALFDADRFKSINDSYGHNEGDRALLLVAEGMRRGAEQSAPGAFLCRYAGDEFVACFETGDLAAAREMANVICAKVTDAAWEAGRPYRLTLTAGVALLDPSAHATAEALVEAADRDMYGRKASRR